MMSKPKFKFLYWDSSTFGTHEGMEAAIIPDEIIQCAVDETPETVKLAVEKFFIGKEFMDCTPSESSDALVINAIFWIMNQTGYTDFGGIIDAYLMLPECLEVFRKLRDDEEWEPLSVEFDEAEWEAIYERS